jgi:hypothetical protein
VKQKETISEIDLLKEEIKQLKKTADAVEVKK